MNDEIEILLSSDVSYEKIVAEIYVKGKFVALLNQDNGKGDLRIEFPGPNFDSEQVLRSVNLELFELAIEKAKARLFEE